MEQPPPRTPAYPHRGSAVQGSPLPENTAQSNAVQENTVQNNAAESNRGRSQRSTLPQPPSRAPDVSPP